MVFSWYSIRNQHGITQYIVEISMDYTIHSSNFNMINTLHNCITKGMSSTGLVLAMEN
jgi:hypothetical protein